MYLGVTTDTDWIGFYIVNSKHPHKVYRGCIDTQWNYYGGLSLGLFIFTPSDEHSNASLIRVHEYGHCIQSLVLGPYMLFVGIISIIWGDLPYFAKLRKEKIFPIQLVLLKHGQANGAK